MKIFISKVTLIIAALFFSISLTAVAGEEATSILIKTSAQCKMCKARIENGLLYVKGIKNATVDLATNNVIVKFKPSKINPDEIRKAITLIGYDADEMQPDKDAYEKLDDCCKKP
ncbi:MAG: heavy-metal-associated domain-containing protein [Flavobacteriales bacterium]|nr:heavy-metal-associated domain-containing protein [Flavobacteriales bacterium]